MIITALRWRINYAKQLLLKIKWELRHLLDFSPKEEVKSISVVVVGRNDNYGGDFSERLRTTLDWNLKHLPNPELIYVEWNPLPDRPSDCNWISKRYPGSKCYIVPGEIHRSISDNPEKMPVMEYFGKNIGIRKAASDWIMVINADVLLGPDTIKNMKRLNRNSVYGTHYVSFTWDHLPISESHFKNRDSVTVAFSVPKNIFPVAGNLILTHRKNWMTATGYDETLTNSRAGVDSNGAAQLAYLGLRQQVLGHHFHLDHPESIVNAPHTSHGDEYIIKTLNNIPYKNPDSWGLEDYLLKKVSDNTWELQKT